MDFEEFLWAKGYTNEQIEELYDCMKETKPLTESQYEAMMNNFKDYMIVGEMLVKEGYKLYFYKNEKGTIEMDFFIRDKNSLIPVEVKANDNATISLKNLIESDKYKDIKYGIKLCNKNIGFNGKFYTFPYFLTFLLKRYLKEK